MRTVKALCGTSNKNDRKALIIERIRGRIRVEGKDEEDFELVINFNEITIRPLKNEAKRLAKEELGLLVYGRNLSYQSENRQDTTLCEVMDCLRPLKRRIKQERKPENVTQEEVKALEERFQGEELPYGWYFNGYNYTDLHGNAQMSHPNKERLMELFCEEENAKVSEWNQSVEKENLADFKKYMEA